ncbi:MAG TPA: hypothetical protein V6C57_18850 [Coleofasciculaceae cyanobacterium]
MLEDDPFLDIFPLDATQFSEEPLLSLDAWAAELAAMDAIVPPPDVSEVEPPQSMWYLGLDFGTTGLSAVLLNRGSCHLYPLYWVEADDSSGTAEPRFRLPAVFSNPSATDAALPLSNFKPYLKLGIPYQAAFSDRWEPVVQWSDSLQIPLVQLVHACQTLLLAVVEQSVGALGLEAALPTVLQQLAGVVIGCPAHWSAAYRYNLRQAVIGAGLVDQPQQIYLVEDAIATLLSTLQSSDGREIVLPQAQSNATLHESHGQGNTLILTAGATVTELALVQVPAELPDLTADHFQIRSIPFAGHALDQDIICQLIYPALQHSEAELLDLPRLDGFVAESVDLAAIALHELTLPLAGEPDLISRYQLQQRLESSRSGQILLEAAQYLKLSLQQQSRCSLKLGHWQQVVLRQDLGSQVLLPYIQRLNRELNSLLNQTQLTVAEIHQVICTGGTASLGAIARWLRQKLPNATIIQDTYPATPSSSSCSRVAYGLAVLPLHSQLLDRAAQPWDDYRLLWELLRVFPSYPISLDEILQRLAAQNVSAQPPQVLALLEKLPAGLVPAATERVLLAPASWNNPDYQAIQAAPLFHLQGDRTYQLNSYQANYLKPYLEAVLSDRERSTIRR